MTDKSIHSSPLSTALFTVLMAFVAPFQVALATTPDGITPAVEDVCDGLIGGTPGLYGLCVAYCEAQDCDSEAAHSGQCTRTPPSEPVLRNYNRKMQPGDPPMPCLAPEPSPCPCLTEEEAGLTHWVGCSIDESGQLRAEGMDGEMFVIDSSNTTCELSGIPGTADRFTGLDDQQFEACRYMIDMAVDYDGINCQNEPPEGED